MLAKAIRIAAEAFENKFDKGGQPYILHCLYVMSEMPEDDEDLRCIAVLHDLLEDTDWTEIDLIKAGFNLRIISGIKKLTHYPIGSPRGQTYDDYIKIIAMNEDARKVKLADLRHNSDIMRMKGLRKKDFDRLEKYHRAYAYLNGV